MAKRILVYDDEAHIAKLVEVNLKQAGYEVVTAATLKELQQKLESECPDMIVMEVADPGMTVPGEGLKFVQGLAADQRFMEMPVIALTRVSEDARIMELWQTPLSSVLTKPFNPAELITFVGRVFAAIDDEDDDEDEDGVWET